MTQQVVISKEIGTVTDDIAAKLGLLHDHASIHRRKVREESVVIPIDRVCLPTSQTMQSPLEMVETVQVSAEVEMTHDIPIQLMEVIVESNEPEPSETLVSSITSTSPIHDIELEEPGSPNWRESPPDSPEQPGDPGSPYVPSSSSSESESESDSKFNEAVDTNEVMESKCIVFISRLLELFQVCHQLGCGKPLNVSPKITYVGFGLTIKTECLDGHPFEWHSHPVVHNIFSGNLQLTAAVFSCGGSYSSFLEVCNTINLKCLSERQCYNLQKVYVIPEVEKMWTIHNEAVIATIADQPRVVSGDARCDSPGHNATFGTYTLIDANTSLIVCQQTVRVTEVKNSYWLEPEGMKRCLDMLMVSW